MDHVSELRHALGRMPTNDELWNYDLSLYKEVLLHEEGMEWGESTADSEGD